MKARLVCGHALFILTNSLFNGVWRAEHVSVCLLGILLNGILLILLTQLLTGGTQLVDVGEVAHEGVLCLTYGRAEKFVLRPSAKLLQFAAPLELLQKEYRPPREEHCDDRDSDAARDDFLLVARLVFQIIYRFLQDHIMKTVRRLHFLSRRHRAASP